MRTCVSAGPVIAAGALALAVNSCGLPEVPAVGSSTDTSMHLAGCKAEGGAPTVAPGGYYTSGATVCTAAGQPHLFHGVDRPSLEWSPTGVNLSAADFALMGSWNANVVRIAMNQDFWLSGAAQYSPTYAATVAQAVAWAEAAGLDVILDLHWSDKGNLAIMTSAQQEMADVNSKEFWSEVAAAYKGDGHVLFELYNEPHDVSLSVWQSGGQADGFTAVGMQDLYNAVRNAGANNLVIAGGLDWAYSLSGVPTNGLQGYNFMYATHPYNESDKQPSGWEAAFGYLATGDIAPVVATEFGDGTTQCTGAWDSQLIAFAAARQISWTAWAWYPGGCSFPALISSWTPPTPTVQGQVVQAALAAFPKPTPFYDAGAIDATLPGLAEDAATDAIPSADDASDALSIGDEPIGAESTGD
jgi:endoglucanase